jgi:CheY-like chemotaxis protein
MRHVESTSILVVDDDPAIRAFVAEALELEGYGAATASNGAEALASLGRVEPRLILLDMRMPVLDGWGVAAVLRERGSGIPIVVMTAAQDGEPLHQRMSTRGSLQLRGAVLDHAPQPFDVRARRRQIADRDVKRVAVANPRVRDEGAAGRIDGGFRPSAVP